MSYTPPAVRIDIFETMAKAAYNQMAINKIGINVNETGCAIYVSAEHRLSLKDILSNPIALKSLMEYAMMDYADALDEYHDDSIR